MKVSQLLGTQVLSFPRRRENEPLVASFEERPPSSIKTLDSRLRGNDGIFSFMAISGGIL